ncbi:MAG: DUF4347 domain-containing protein, partial [Rhizobiaceae bacterium]
MNYKAAEISQFEDDRGDEQSRGSESVSVLFYRELEPRIALDAAAVETAIDLQGDDSADTASTKLQVEIENPVGDALEKLDQAFAAVGGTGEIRNEIVFVDPSVDDIETIISSLSRDAEVYVLDATRDGIEQISEIVATHSDIDAIHIISHGSAGEVLLGTGSLSLDSMKGEYANELATIASALAENADFLFYGCNFGDGEIGQQTIQRLAELTGADIAASSDVTGHRSLGGDWELEVHAGVIEAFGAINSLGQENWVSALATVTVDTTSDAANGDTSSIANLIANDGGDGISLREAIMAANNTAGVDDIHFNITVVDPNYVDPDATAASGDEYWEIYVGASGLPYLLDQVNLDATTQPGYNVLTGRPVVELDGSATPGGSGINGIALRTDNSTVSGFAVHSFADEGMEIDGSTGFGDNNTFRNNWVGIDAEENFAPNAEHAVLVSVNADGNTIGGTGANDGNVIVNAPGGFHGLNIRDNSMNTVVEGNYIGVMPDGITAAGNGANGIFIELNSNNTRIGGLAASAGNVISGNTADGIGLDNVTGTLIWGNIVGMDSSGMFAVANGDDGIDIKNGATNNTVGGNITAHRNIISGNMQNGVYLESGNNRVIGNYIGADITGTGGPGNGAAGVRAWNAGTNNVIGTTSTSEGNLIAYNGGDGVEIQGTTTQTSISANDIRDNAGLGIDLNSDGVTLNDVGDGDIGNNALQNFPVLLAAQSTGAQVSIVGSLNSNAGRSYRIEFFENATADLSGYGEGGTYLGFITVVTDGSGNASINAVLPVSVGANSTITSTATDLTTNDTSEFGLNVAINDAPAITSDGGGAAAAVNAAENQTSVTTVTASDPDLPPDTLTYSLIGGADQALFSITPGGVLTFNTAPDFEAPTDFDTNGVYEVIVQVDDGNGGTDTQA